jgi:hypothetical protein
MDTPSEPATHANHGIDWDDVEAHHHPVTLVRRPVYEGWVLTLFGLILVGRSCSSILRINEMDLFGGPT